MECGATLDQSLGWMTTRSSMIPLCFSFLLCTQGERVIIPPEAIEVLWMSTAYHRASLWWVLLSLLKMDTPETAEPFAGSLYSKCRARLQDC